MNNTNKLIWGISIAALCGLGYVVYNITSKQSKTNPARIVDSDYSYNTETSFSDGLPNPSSVTTYPLGEDGVGISEKSIYLIDINKDRYPDRITKTYFENGNAHSYYEYTVELNIDGEYLDITPDNLHTINGADCDLQQIQFSFRPEFKITVIYRTMGDTWIDPTMAQRRVYSLDNNRIKSSKVKQLRAVCDVKELF